MWKIDEWKSNKPDNLELLFAKKEKMIFSKWPHYLNICTVKTFLKFSNWNSTSSKHEYSITLHMSNIDIQTYNTQGNHPFFKDFIHLFSERGKGKEKERERNINVWLPLSLTPYRGSGPQPRHVPWLGIELVTLWFSGRHSIQWGTPARAHF